MTHVYDFKNTDDVQLWEEMEPNLPWSQSGDASIAAPGTPDWAIIRNYYPDPLNHGDGLPATEGIVDGALQLSIRPSPNIEASAEQPWLAGMITERSVVTPGTYLSSTFTLTTAPGIEGYAYLLSTDTSNRAEIDLFETTDGGDGKWVHQSVHADGQTWTAQTFLPSLSDAPHTAGVDIEKDMLTFYLDGRMTLQVPTPSDIDAAPMRLTLQTVRATPGYWAVDSSSVTTDYAAMRVFNVAEFSTHPH